MKKDIEKGWAIQLLILAEDLRDLLKSNQKATTVDELREVNDTLIKVVHNFLGFTAGFVDKDINFIFEDDKNK